MKVKNTQLDEIVKAFAELGLNKFAYNLNSRIHNAGKCFRKAKEERDEEKNSILKPYLPEGQNIGEVEIEKDKTEGFDDMLKALDDLWSKEIEIDFGAYVLKDDLKTIKKEFPEISSNNQGILEDIGFILEKAPEPKPES